MTDSVTKASRTTARKRGVNYREIVRAMRTLEIGSTTPVIVHSSLSAFGQVHGGAPTVVGALLELYNTIMMPIFTYKTMVVPETGPPNNALRYGEHTDRNKMAEFFHPAMPADPLMGKVAETLRQHPDAFRSGHPVLSFAGVNARDYLLKQMLSEPFAPIAAMCDAGGWVLLMGVDHTSNTSIHLGERLAGRKMFTRWALMSDTIVTCENFPFCSDGFNGIQILIEPFIKKVQVGNALVQAIPLAELIETTRQLVEADPTALLCSRTDCLACNSIRRDIVKSKQAQ